MKKHLLLLSLLFLGVLSAAAGNYKNFNVAVYTRAYEVEKMKDMQWLESTWQTISSQIKVDKIYLETHRDLLIVPQETLDQAKKFFKEHGVEVGGGITYTINEANNFETFSYSDPAHRQKVREIAEYTAKNFDDFILDDFFFTSAKSDYDIAAKGKLTWPEFRTRLMTEAGQNLVINPAKAVNPKVKVIIKYPNWYDDFQGLGFDLEHGPQIFDGVWTGTETRDPAGDQHLQNYLSYNVIRYFEHLRPGHTFGGWVDSGGINMSMDRYAEQLWLTMFAKAPEMSLFAYNQLIGVDIKDSYKAKWQDGKMETSFSWKEMMKPVKQADGSTVKPTTMARAAGLVFEKIDPIVGQLGNPVGLKSYKVFHTWGEDFLQNWLGMIGLPMEMVPYFPAEEKVILLTEQAKGDPDLAKKMADYLQKGGKIIITSGLLKAIPEEIGKMVELRVDGDVIDNDFGRYGKADRDLLIPKVEYYTNDSWELLSAGRPLSGGTSGWPILLRGDYSKGSLYCLTVPEDFSDFYHMPQTALNVIRQHLSQGLKVRLEAPAYVSLFLYDNDTFIVENFQDEPVDVGVLCPESCKQITNLETGATINADAQTVNAFGRYKMDPTSRFGVKIAPHSFIAFKMK